MPYTSEATEIRADGQLVTVSLSRMLEATEAAARDVRIILNWGSRADQVKDADSHLACACGAPGPPRLLQEPRATTSRGHVVELDVDDTDWGGPETITLTQPAERQLHLLGARLQRPAGACSATSDLVVRVLIGSEQAGEFQVYKGLTRRAWRPFKAIEVSGRRPARARALDRGRDRRRPGPRGARPSCSRPIRRRAPPAAALACPATVARDRAR